MKRILCLTTYSDLAPSVGFRILPYLRGLMELGYPCRHIPAHSQKLDSLLSSPGRYLVKSLYMTLALARWLSRLRASYDLVIVHRGAALVGPPLVERTLARLHKPLIFDFDDAIYLRMPSKTNGRLAALLRPADKTRELIALSSAVSAGNETLAAYARQYNQRVLILPTAIDTARFSPTDGREPASVPILGWVGSHSTAPYIEELLPALRRLGQRCRFTLLIVGAGKPLKAAGLEIENRAWSRTRMVEDFQDLDIGLYPLPDDEWSRGKCGFKGIQYHAVGKPVVCSPVGVNARIIVDGVTGFHARTPAEWGERLEQLLSDPLLRARMGAAGRAHILANYALPDHVRRLAALVEEVG